MSVNENRYKIGRSSYKTGIASESSIFDIFMLYILNYCSEVSFNLFQLFTNSMVEAGLIENPRILLESLNELLTTALEKHQ